MNASGFKLEHLLKDDDNNTSVNVTLALSLSYTNKTSNANVSVIGENLGCSSEEDGKLFIVPVCSWNEVTKPLGPVKMCRL